jgi:hypothetical protein
MRRILLKLPAGMFVEHEGVTYTLLVPLRMELGFLSLINTTEQVPGGAP